MQAFNHPPTPVKKLLVLALTTALAAGCQTTPSPSSLVSQRHTAFKQYEIDDNRTKSLMKSGVEYLQKGEIEKAQKVFNTGLKFDLNHAGLHFFNAYTYQLKFEKGDSDSFVTSEAGYKTALALDPTLDAAYMQLGKLYLFSGNFLEAKKSYALAVDARQSSPQEALLGLAQASMLSGDAQTAVFATRKLDALNWQDARLYRLKALLSAMAKQPQQAAEMVERYTALEKHPKETRYLQTRVDQLLSMKSHGWVSDSILPSDQPLVLAQAKADEPVEKSKETAGEKKADAQPSEERKNWFRCDPRPAPVSEKDATPLLGNGQMPVSEENAFAPALPAPCPGEMPPSAMIEVTLIRTEETVQKSFGVNLMDGLNLGRSFTQAADGSITKTSQLYNAMASATTAAPVGATASVSQGFLNYSLNIANSLYTKNEVIARPTLAAVDRLPSVFFSGGNLSIKVASSVAGTASTVVDKSIGVVLSITPTFLDDDHVLLNIRASRSFIEDNPDTTNIALHVTRNAVNAATKVKFGQTFILNGLIEREKDQSRNGVPVFQDIPVLQYLFSKQVTLDYNRQILTLITVRKLIDSDDSVIKAKDTKGAISTHKLSDEVDAFMNLQNNRPVLDEVLTGLKKDNFLFKKLSQRDVLQDSQGSHKGLDNLVRDLKELFYF
jgi:tetratricopeptide (TPR) repeat protein